MNALGLAVLAIAALCATLAHAAVVPPPIEHVAFAPGANAVLPLDVALTDEHGERVQLRDYLDRGPAIVVPAYFACSNLCGIVLHGLAQDLSTAAIEAGRDVEVIAVSIAPDEGPDAALEKKRMVLGEDVPGWHFLTGDEAAIHAVSAALGYRYAYDPVERQYAHASGIAIVSPRGRISRVMYGVAFPERELHEALATARARDPPPAEADATADLARTWLLCFHYDPHTGRYTFAAMNAVRIAALVALTALCFAIIRMCRHERGARS